MARQARFVIPGAAHHVTQRGNNRQEVFWCAEDRLVYLAYMKESAARCGLDISAYCLMSNHIHLVATPRTDDALAKALGRAHLMYAQYIHRLHGRLGHFWQSRFYSCPMDEAHAHHAAAYVELNPVRAGLAARPWDYPWSSAGAHCGTAGDAAGLLALDEWLECMPVKEWKATLKAIGKSEEAIEAVRLHTRTGRPLGDDSFLSKLEALVGRRVRPLPVGRQKGWRKPSPSPNLKSKEGE